MIVLVTGASSVGCSASVDHEEDPASFEANAVVVGSAIAAPNLAGYWANGYDGTPGAVGVVRLADDGSFEGTFMIEGGRRSNERGTWSATVTGQTGSLRFESQGGTRIYPFEITAYGTPIFGASNPDWDAIIQVTLPSGARSRLFGYKITK
jgi:hypothetical protein